MESGRQRPGGPHRHAALGRGRPGRKATSRKPNASRRARGIAAAPAPASRRGSSTGKTVRAARLWSRINQGSARPGESRRRFCRSAQRGTPARQVAHSPPRPTHRPATARQHRHRRRTRRIAHRTQPSPVRPLGGLPRQSSAGRPSQEGSPARQSAGQEGRTSPWTSPRTSSSSPPRCQPAPFPAPPPPPKR